MDVTDLRRRLSKQLGVRSNRTLVLAGVTGAATGAGVAAFDWITKEQIFERILRLPIALQAVALVVGLAVAAASLLWLAGDASPATTDDYIKNFHEPDRLSLRPAIGKMVAGAATLGSGGALGFEGPSLYLGAVVGSALQTRWSKLFSRDDSKVLMVAGAAAGVAAIFKAPATGAVFALEVPYRDDTARRMLLPALVGAATGYLTFVALAGTTPLFATGGSPPFDLRELGGAVILGIVCGFGARVFAKLISFAKSLASYGHPIVRIGAAGAILTALLVASNAIFGEGLSTGSGYRTLEWGTQPNHTLVLIITLLVIRCLAAATTLGAGGVGGLFVPLVVAGALVGDATATALHDTSTLFPLIGVAAFLGAGYRTPLAGVMFVAETTGRPGFIVPGLIASVAAQLVMRDASVSPYQAAGRTGHLERRFTLPIARAVDADVRTVPSDATIDELYEHNLLLVREIEVPVVDENKYRGMITIDDVRSIDREQWATTVVADVLHDDWPVAQLGWNLRRAVQAMEAAGVETLPVIAPDGVFIGVTTTSGIIKLDEILGNPGGD